ncbi:MAG: 50S ribosomal protein L29 [Oscillatoriales cyanobacterium RM1_1_9]|nr:50S ribosomal protein L29 [Oscillatoriales cyanobacterium RM2_1_1]NJO71553.1 50S ribosomal protein L29 [Oscillatoriales cyanobacterium RM1_1_9]
MAFPKAEEARQLTDEELSEQILEVKRKLANLRLLQATGRLEKTHEFKHARHRLAQLMTVEHERKQPEVPVTPVVAPVESVEPPKETSAVSEGAAEETEPEEA